MTNTYTYFSNTIGEYELFIRSGYFYWPRNIIKKTEYQREKNNIVPEEVGDIVYIVAGNNIKTSIKDHYLKSKITMAPMLTHKGHVDKIENHPIICFNFIHSGYRSYKKQENYTYGIPLEAISSLMNLSNYLGKALNDKDKDELKIGNEICRIVDNMKANNELNFSDAYSDKNGNLFIYDENDKSYYSIKPFLKRLTYLPSVSKGQQKRKTISKKCLERIMTELSKKVSNAAEYVSKISTWHGEEYVKVKIDEEIFKELKNVSLPQGISTRQIMKEDSSNDVVCEINNVLYSEAGNSRVNKQEEGKDMDKNIILYGPPGTGKTYNVINKALEVIDSDKYSNFINDPSKRNEMVEEYNKLVEAGQIAFCTFHQSYSYEDFVEGLRSDQNGGFVPKDGIFKQICNKAKEVKNSIVSEYDFDEGSTNFYKMSLGDTQNEEDDSVFDYCIENDCVALGWGEDIDYTGCSSKHEVRDKYLGKNPQISNSDFNIDAINRFKNNIKTDDIIIVSYGNAKARAIAKVTGNYYYNPNTEIGFNHFRKVQWLYNGEIIDVRKILKEKNFSQMSIYKFSKEDVDIQSVRELVSIKSNKDNKDRNYVLIIDEINRGNISKIFGELITLIECDKRIGEKNEIKVTLPYSNDKFGVPNNLYIIGTMNTADRSIALMDTALRRRFSFEEYMPKAELLGENIDGINLRQFLSTINSRIEFLFDREHTIGHAYFIKENIAFDNLVSIMKNKVIPLLQEYFYGDWEKIELILGGAGDIGDNKFFIAKEKMNPNSLFKKNISSEYPEQYKYFIVENPSKEAFINVYTDITSGEE